MIASIVVMGHVTIGFLWNRSNVRVHETKPGCHARGRVLVHTRSLHTGSFSGWQTCWYSAFCLCRQHDRDEAPAPALPPHRMHRYDITSIRYTKWISQERLQHHHNVLSRVYVSLPVVQAKDSFFPAPVMTVP